jgi:hypothetical protein
MLSFGQFALSYALPISDSQKETRQGLTRNGPDVPQLRAEVLATAKLSCHLHSSDDTIGLAVIAENRR